MRIEIVSDDAVAQVAERIDFDGAVRTAFIAATDGSAHHAPVLRVPGARSGEAINLKFGTSMGLLGGKLGTYWVANAARGLPNHAATTILLDPETGFPRALLSARLLNRLRTAAGDAVGTDALARPDAAILALVGAGEQALFEAQAIARVRRLSEIRIASRDPARAAVLVARLRGTAARVEHRPVEEAVRGADIVVTATSARTPVLSADWITAGAHVSAMGSDAVGKQELDPALFARALLFADLPSQAVVVGESQHAPLPPVAIGDVLADQVGGRASGEEITIFDSSGIAAQDLHVAEAALTMVRDAGLVQEVDW